MPITLDLIARAEAGESEAMQAVYEATIQSPAPDDAAPIAGIEVAEKSANGTVLRLVATVPPTAT